MNILHKNGQIRRGARQVPLGMEDPPLPAVAYLPSGMYRPVGIKTQLSTDHLACLGRGY